MTKGQRTIVALLAVVAVLLGLNRLGDPPEAEAREVASAGPEGEADVCSLPPDPGPCDGVCPRWFLNAETGTCEMFIWGCCEGNANNFESLEECEAACGDSCPPDITGDGTVGVEDLLALLAAWGGCPPPCPPTCPADLDRDCAVSVVDLLQLLAAWGPCP